MTPAPLEVMEAFERLAFGVQKHPFAFLLPADAEAIGRAVLTNGLTLEQAKIVRKNLDTNAERARVKVILMQVVSFADAKTLLTWLLADLQRALAAEKKETTEVTESTEAGPVAGGATAETGPRILTIKHRGKWDVFIRADGCDGWPTRTETKDGKPKTTQGKLYIKGVYVDAMRPDQFKGALKELNNAFGPNGTEHTIDAQPGETVPVVIKSFHGQETAVFSWLWPFAAI